MISTTAPSSAEVIQFGQPAKPEHKALTFAQARGKWLERWQADIQLTLADKVLVTQVYRHFNQVHFNQTGQLLAWPGWETITQAGLSRASVFRGFRKLERLGALEILRGRDPKTGWKLPNKYLTTPSPGFTMRPGQVSQCDQARFHGETRLLDGTDSLNKNDSLKRKKVTKKEEAHKIFGNSRKEGQKKKQASKPSENLPSSSEAPFSKTPYPPSSARPPSPLGREDRWADRWRRERAEAEATLERYRVMALAAQNGGDQ